MESIGPNTLVTFTYQLFDMQNRLLEQSDPEGTSYVHGYGMLVPGLERVLQGCKAGECFAVTLSPEAAFGEHDESLVFEIAHEELPHPPPFVLGEEFLAEGPQGEQTFRVVALLSDGVRVDANAPLAGVTLRYLVTVNSLRPATMEEIAQVAEAFDEAEALAEAEEMPACERPDVPLHHLTRNMPQR